jgi:hypothetical protein
MVSEICRFLNQPRAFMVFLCNSGGVGHTDLFSNCWTHGCSILLSAAYNYCLRVPDPRQSVVLFSIEHPFMEMLPYKTRPLSLP